MFGKMNQRKDRKKAKYNKRQVRLADQYAKKYDVFRKKVRRWEEVYWQKRI